MKSLTMLLVLIMLTALVVSLIASPTEEENPSFDDNMEISDIFHLENQESTSFREASRFLAQKTLTRGSMKCNKYPRVCHVKDSPGPDCCKKKCVNVMTDRSNCGMCGRKCRYSEICCKGKCVNPKSDRKHCGSCDNKCNKGFSCSYGMCSYA